MRLRSLRYLALGVVLLSVCAAAVLTLDAFRPLRFRWASKLILANRQRVVDAFAILFHAEGDRTYNNLRWLGTPLQKNPMDLWIYQEMLYEVKPDVVVECGTYKGGTAYYLARLMDLLDKGRILTVDIEKYPNLPQHPRITYLLGSSTAPEIVGQVRSSIKPGETVLVLLDSDHSMKHVLDELRLYHGLVTAGSYLVVEDTHFNGHPILPKFGPGPMEAVEQFLKENQDFRIDPAREKLMFTFNPRGYLVKKPSAR
jgi:cephalosporin hydroxylase